jgi:sorting nexin-25
MEFMDRRNRSLPVQFWLTVESFKNPLESVDSDSSADEADPLPLPSSPVSTAREDITMIYELYFSGPTRPPALSAISQKHVEAIRSFSTADELPNVLMERKVRRSVLLAQRQIERDMEQQDFEDFERSELWFRVVGDIVHHPTSTKEESSIKSGSPSPPHTPIPRSESTPALVEQQDKPASVKSGRSARSMAAGVQPIFNSRSHPSLGLEALMSSIEEPTRAPLFDDPDDRAAINEERAQIQRMEAIQAALTDIIAGEEGDDKRKSIMSRSESSNLSASVGHGSRIGSEDRRKRRGVFDDYDEIEEQEREEEEVENKNLQAAGTFTLATPGDLHLSYEIARLSGKITHLERQETMLDALIRKAELTGDAQELRLLNKSKSAMARDLRELRFQKTQYEQQESANRLHSDRTRVAIVSSTTGEEDGKSVVRYLVQVQQLGLDENVASGWVVARRYNEFLSMHNKLKERFAMVRQLDFPGKRLVTALSGNFVDNRRQALEKYMQVSYHLG